MELKEVLSTFLKECSPHKESISESSWLGNIGRKESLSFEDLCYLKLMIYFT